LLKKTISDKEKRFKSFADMPKSSTFALAKPKSERP
jgi:hypothetical protein